MMEHLPSDCLFVNVELQCTNFLMRCYILLILLASLHICSADLVDPISGTRFLLKWEASTGLTTYRSTILYDDGKIVVASNGQTSNSVVDPLDGVYLLDANTGEVLQQLQGSLVGDTDVNGVAWHRDRLFFGDDNDRFYCFKESGEKVWEFQGMGDVESAPALTDLNGDYFPDVVFATEAGWLYALNGKNGSMLWSLETEMEPAPGKYGALSSKAFMASPAVVDLNYDGVRDVLIGARNAVFYAVDGASGDVLWKYHVGTGIHSSALVSRSENDLRIVFAEAYSELHVLDQDGERRGEGELSAPTGGIQGFFSSPLITPSGSIIIGSAWWDRGWQEPQYQGLEGDGFWIFHPFSKSKEARKFEGAGRITASPFLADLLDEFYPQVGFVTENGVLLLVYPTGEVAARFELPAGAEASPLVADIDADGMHELLIATTDGRLRCYDTNSEGNIEWGQFRGNNYNTGVMRDVVHIAVPLIDKVSQWAASYPEFVTVGGIYAFVFFVLSVIYWIHPLALLYFDRWLRKIKNLPLPGPLAAFETAIRYLLLVRSFAYRPRVLDAWVDRRLPTVSEQFELRKTVQSRRIHIGLPAMVNGKMLADLSVSDLCHVFSNKRALIGIVGEGGSGKTSVACYISRAAMQDKPEERLNPECRMLPVLLEPMSLSESKSEGDQLIVQVTNALSLMLDDPLENDTELIGQLLKRKRILVILDGLSEMSESLRTSLKPNRANYLANAIVVTSRNAEELGDMRCTLVKTMRIEGTRLSSFMEAYFLKVGAKQQFADAEFFAACSRLSELVGESEITVLLAKMYADQVIGAKAKSLNLDALPETIPDLTIGYIKALNDKITDGQTPFREVRAVAQRIAWESVRVTFLPEPVRRSRVHKLFSEYDDADAVVEYLIQRLGVLESEGVNQVLLRFGLDPLAEYMAASYLVDSYRNDGAKWRTFLEDIEPLDISVPERRGFFKALRDCCQATQGDTRVPDFVVEELEQRLTSELSEEK